MGSLRWGFRGGKQITTLCKVNCAPLSPHSRLELLAPLLQLGNTSLEWLIVKYHKAIRSRYMVTHTKLYFTVGIIVYLTVLHLPTRFIYDSA